MTPLQLAALFHEAYERLAPSYRYMTRPQTREFRPAFPNGRLMIAVCQEILDKFDVTPKQVTTGTYKCQRCGSTREPLVTYCTAPEIAGTMTTCLSCGQVQEQWPYPLSDYEQAKGRLHRIPEAT